jgi:hypothetical protein
VLLAMRALLDGWEQAPAAAVRPLQAVGRVEDAAAARTTAAPPRASPAPSKAAEVAAWDHLRLAVREARTTRGVTTEALVKELGLAHATVRTALNTRRPPTMRLRQRLTDWLAASEVAIGSATFRAGGIGNGNGNGAGNGTGNGADHPDAGHRSGLHLG